MKEEDSNELKKNTHKIGESYTNEDGQLCRMVDGKEIIQIQENTPEDRERNNLINLWRMRK